MSGNKYGIFGTEAEFNGWLLMLSHRTRCDGDKFRPATISGGVGITTRLQGCCQYHTVLDCLKHAGEDGMSAGDRTTCQLAIEYLERGNGINAGAPRVLGELDYDNEVEH